MSPRQRDAVLASSFALLTVLSRLPYRARMLYNWDAVQFALALKEFDVAKHQPHPPGYVLYVLMGRLVDGLLHDPNASYVTLAVLASGATTFVVYFLAKVLYGRMTAVAAASLMAVSPLFWFYGEVALTYAGEALVASAVAYLAYGALQGSERHVYLSAIYLGLAGGMRQSILLMLFPLWFMCAAVGRRSMRALCLGLGAMAAAILAWFLPMIWLTGGLDRYLEAFRELFTSVVRPTSVFGAETVDVTLAQLRSLLVSTAVGLGPLLLAFLALPFYRRRHGWGRTEWFLLGWIAPPMAFYTFVHFGQAGYVLTFLPALVILLSRVLVAVLQAVGQHLSRPEARWALVGSVLMALVLANGAFFVSAKPLPRDFEGERLGSRVERLVSLAKADAHDWIWSRTAAALREHEEVLGSYVSAIKTLYDPSETAILTELGNPRSYPWLRHAMFYLSDYPIYQLRLGDAPRGFYAPQSSATMMFTHESRIVLPSRVRRLVWFVDYFHPAASRPKGLAEIALPYGRWLYVLPIRSRPVKYAGYTFVVAKEPRRAVRVHR